MTKSGISDEQIERAVRLFRDQLIEHRAEIDSGRLDRLLSDSGFPAALVKFIQRARVAHKSKGQAEQDAADTRRAKKREVCVEW